MYCRICGAQVPDGDAFCPECGARQRSVEPEQNIGGNVQQPRMRTGVLEPLRSFYSARKILLVLGGIMVGVTLLMLYFVITGMESFYGYYYASESLANYLNFYAVIMIIQALIILAVAIWELVLLNQLKAYEERFGQVVVFILLGVLISVIDAFSKDENTGLKVILTLADAAFGILAYYHLCGAFADLTRPWDRSLADKWDFIFKLYLGVQALAFLSGIILGINAGNPGSWGFVYFLLLVSTAASFAVSVYELKHIKKTIGLFERGHSGY